MTLQAPLHAPETKSAEVEAEFEAFARGFEQYRQTNDERVRQLEARNRADPLTEEKMARIEASLDQHKARIDRLALERSRPALGGEAPRDPAAVEHKAAFGLYVRAGEAAGLKDLEAKALAAGAGPDGGYLVPETLEREVIRRLAALSPIRGLASSRTVSGGLYKRAVSVTGPASGWVGETAPRPETAGSTLSEQSFPTMELYAMPAATQTLLDDAVVDVEAWIADEIETAFAEQESRAFVEGDGASRPKGFLAYPLAPEGAPAWGKLEALRTGAAGAFPAEAPSDVLIRLAYALKAGYRQNAAFVMNRKTQSLIRRMKDANGNYLWQPPAQAGGPATLMGFPVAEAEDMPDPSASSLSIAFGDFRRGYLVVDRTGLRILRDPYTAKPYVLFYTTKRVGGGVQDFDAIKLLMFAE